MNQLDALIRIVASLNEAALDDTHWPTASALIDDACTVKGNYLVCAWGHSEVDVRIFHSRFYHRGQRREDLEHEYFSAYYAIDERVPRFRRLPEGKLVHTRDLLTDQELRTSPTYNELLPRADFQNGVAVRLDGPYGTRIAWGIGDPIDGEDWSSAQIDMIEHLSPHLRQYVAIRQALVDAGALGTSLTRLLDHRVFCVIQLDRHGRIVEANDAAHELLRRSDGLSDPGGILRAWSPADDAELQMLLGRALPRFGDQGVGGSMTLRRPSVSPRLVLHISPVGGAQRDFRPLRVAALVLVVDPVSRARVDASLVSVVLGLTPAESQVAAMLAEGKTVREIAVATDRSEKTIRWHLHQICSKHGISRQVELVQLVLSLVDIPPARS